VRNADFSRDQPQDDMSGQQYEDATLPQPDRATIQVVGPGGRHFWHTMLAASAGPPGEVLKRI